VWGKSWHIPGIVTAVAERLECFTQAGLPRRSLMRLLFRRVLEPITPAPRAAGPGPKRSATGQTSGFQGLGERLESHEVLGGERPDQLAFSLYRDPAMARALMTHNDIDDPLRIPAGTILDLPPLSDLENLP
jgi:hypothetical protein